MLVLITCDVNTGDAVRPQTSAACVARQCVNYGQRVQNSVFECLLNAAQYRRVRNLLRAYR